MHIDKCFEAQFNVGVPLCFEMTRLTGASDYKPCGNEQPYHRFR